MTFIIKTSGDPNALVVLEYICPVHGRFESLEPRATAPDSRPCPFVYPGDPEGLCQCGCNDDESCEMKSPWSPSAPKTKIQYGTALRGGSDERPPGALDTRPLAEGMSHQEWSAKTRKAIYTERRDKARKELL